MLEAIFTGIGGADLAMTANRIAVGAFFCVTGGFKLIKPSWRVGLAKTLRDAHVPFVKFNTWWVPSVEFAAGGACIIGLLAPLAAAGLLTIMLVALYSDGGRKVHDLDPESPLETADDWLYIPETLYALMLISIICAGSGPY